MHDTAILEKCCSGRSNIPSMLLIFGNWFAEGGLDGIGGRISII